MEELPSEILDRIISHCDHLACKRLRLVHSSLHDAASASVFKEIHMGIFKFGLQKLQRISNSRLARYVRSFHLYWDFLPILTRMEWESRIDQRPSFQEFFESCEEDADGEEWFSRAKCWQWYSSLDKYKYSKAEMDEAWKAWTAYYCDQRSWNWMNDSMKMVDALSRLQCLQRAEVRVAETGNYHLHYPDSQGVQRWGPSVNETPLWRRLKSEILMGPDDWVELGATTFNERQSLNPTSILLTALEHRASEPVTTSEISTLKLVHRHRHKQYNPLSSSRDRLTQTFRGLQKLQLNVSYEFPPEPDDLGNVSLEIMGFLRAAENLRVLDLTLGYADGFRHRNPEEKFGLAELFRLDGTIWPMLSHFSLSANITAKDLIHFLQNHRRTLRGLELWNLECDDWTAVLTSIPQMLELESVYLENLWHTKECVVDSNADEDHRCELLFPLRRRVGGGKGSIEEYLLRKSETFPGLI